MKVHFFILNLNIIGCLSKVEMSYKLQVATKNEVNLELFQSRSTFVFVFKSICHRFDI